MTKDELKKIYQTGIETFGQEVQEFEKILWYNSLIRISIFLIVCTVIYFFWTVGTPLIFFFIAGLILFLYFVKRQLKFRYKRDFAKKLVERNTIEFFQYVNRTSLRNGPVQLANLLKSNESNNIIERQKVVQELSGKKDWRHEFWAEASLVNVEVDPEEIIKWTSDYKNIVPSFMKYVIYGFSIISVVFIMLFALGIIPEGIIVLWFLLGLGISGGFIKKINNLSTNASRSLSTFNQYAKLLTRIENQSWESTLLRNKQAQLDSEEIQASTSINIFGKYLNALDQRSNIFIAVFTNGLFLRDIFCTIRIEDWIAKNQSTIRNWFDVIEYFDVQNSLANFDYNHPSYMYPKISKEIKEVFRADNLGHPLLLEEKRVDNNFQISNESFYIITGANMAGKSTFLRTVSLSIVMSNMGLPICGVGPVYRPLKLISSMRTSDSLTNDESYFFSELKRLRYIIDTIKDDRYFIILDEILKGTNSVDKAAGSKKFVERLLKSKSTAIIATHDLSLCETADDFKEVENYYFDAQIINDELFFDYTLKPGICQNMNASFLLRKMEIV